MDEPLDSLSRRARSCAQCVDLPLGPRPMFRVSETARLLIIGQAPGTKVHETGIPWNDRSGDRLRGWMGLDRERFYDTTRIAILPMGLCYPGRLPRGGDRPPRPVCGPLWHPPFLAAMPRIECVLLVGHHAQIFYLGNRRHPTMTETVRAGAVYGPRYFPLPHPSWRNTAWMNRNPWFSAAVLPRLRARVKALVDDGSGERGQWERPPGG